METEVTGDRRQPVSDALACKLFLNAAFGAVSINSAEAVFAHPAFDWQGQAQYLTRCGLSRPLLRALNESPLKQYAPDSFVEQMKATAVLDSVKEALQRETIRLISETLQEIGAQGVLLKGCAILMLESASKTTHNIRATGDVDIYVESLSAQKLREQLLKCDFAGRENAPRTAPHHLAPVVYQGIAVEIHTGLMPAFWGIPERELLETTIPVPQSKSLHTLSGEGLLLHAGIHASAHLYSFGLKTAWDVYWILRHYGKLDWQRLAEYVNATAMPRSFWVPVRVLAEELAIALPQEFLRCAPADKRQKKLEVFARLHLFSDMEGAFELNPFSKNTLFLLLHDSWKSRLHYLRSLAGGGAAESRQSARRNVEAQAASHLPAQLLSAFREWRTYRRSLHL